MSATSAAPLPAQFAGQVSGIDRHAERPGERHRRHRLRLALVLPVSQLENGQFRTLRVGIHDPVGRDTELPVDGLLPVQVNERRGRRADLDRQKRGLGELRASDLVDPDDNEIRDELGVGVNLQRGLGYDAEVIGQTRSRTPISLVSAN